MTTTTETRVEARRVIPAAPSEIFALLADPQGHVAIDSSGMLMAASGSPVSAVGDTFEVQMNREALGDIPLGRYTVTIKITAFSSNSEIAWTVVTPLADPPIGHIYGYSLRPVPEGTEVISYCDWSNIDPIWRGPDMPALGLDVNLTWPIVPGTALRATLGILERTVAARSAG